MRLGTFEYTMLAAIIRIGDGAYGMNVQQEIARRTGRTPTVGALYATLDRLKSKGLVTSWLGEITPRKGGRAKRFFSVTFSGEKAVREFETAIRSMQLECA